jgi:hypothetical protein
MIMEIGFAAGDIWQFLDRQPNQTARFSQLAAKIALSKELLLMSVGWLAREGHVILKLEGNDYFVSLRNPQQIASK